MKLVEPGFKIEWGSDGEEALRRIECAARTCYKTEDKIGPGSAEALVKKLLKLKHMAMIEFADACIRFVIDRGVSHELVRHRLCSFGQESTRYCNYGKEKFGKTISVILPFWFREAYEKFGIPDEGQIYGEARFLPPRVTPVEQQYFMWTIGIRCSQNIYLKMLADGASAQEARSVLPNSLKTEVVTGANLREWHTIFGLRATNPFAHPQIRQVMIPTLLKMQGNIPLIFDDLIPEDGIFRNTDGSAFLPENYAKEIPITCKI